MLPARETMGNQLFSLDFSRSAPRRSLPVPRAGPFPFPAHAFCSSACTFPIRPPNEAGAVVRNTDGKSLNIQRHFSYMGKLKGLSLLTLK